MHFHFLSPVMVVFDKIPAPPLLRNRWDGFSSVVENAARESFFYFFSAGVRYP